ncbi:MAG: hypothetical protein H6656_19065 [Ardenticatenaceae bacterium]|nr:hypothetical protein [Ardenticatenaceae bacterium]
MNINPFSHIGIPSLKHLWRHGCQPLLARLPLTNWPTAVARPARPD